MRFQVLLFFIFSLLSAGCSPSDYQPPETRKASDGWLDYIDPPAYGPEECANLDPAPGPPEAAVVKFLSSRVRGDDKYLEAALPENLWDGKTFRNMEEWKNWKVTRFQLRKKRYEDDGEISVEVFMEVEFKGKLKNGVDEFSVVKQGNKWLILYPPT